jgi:hypothetical protein
VREQEHQTTCYEGEGRGDQKRITTCGIGVVACGLLDGVEGVGTSEGADFADSGCDAIVLSSVSDQRPFLIKR